MAELDEKLKAFEDWALELVRHTNLPYLQIGLLYIQEQEANLLIALGAELAHEPQPFKKLEAGSVRAYKLTAESSALGSLLRQLSAGEVTAIAGEEWSPPLLLRREKDSFYFWAEKQKRLDDRLVVFAEGRSGEAKPELGRRIAELDRDIARQSDFSLASVLRAITSYTGVQFNPGGPSDRVRLVAPWPIHAVHASRAGKRVRLDLSASPGFDPSTLAVNVESPSGDQRLLERQTTWQPLEREGNLTSLKGTVDAGIPVTAVNLFFIPASFVAVHARVEEQDSLGIVTSGERAPSPAPRARSSGSRLVGISVEGFRSLRRTSLELDPALTVIVGPNQAGKSNLLDAMSVIAEAARGELAAAIGRRRGGFGTIAFKSPQTSAEAIKLGAVVAIDSRKLRYSFALQPFGNHSFEVESESLEVWSDGQWTPRVQFKHGRGGFGARPANAVQIRELALTQVADPDGQGEWDAVRDALASIAIYPGFDAAPVGSAEPNTMRGPSAPEEHGQLNPRGENLSAALLMLRAANPEAWTRLEDLTRLVFPALVNLSFFEDVRGNALLVWKDQSGDFDASSLSAGTLSFLATLCALFQENSAAIGLDEPEEHLHPDALIRVFGAAESVAALRPVVIATQSTYLLELLTRTPQSLVVARRGDDGTELIRPELEHLKEWLKDFSLGQIRTDLENWVAQ